MVRVGVVGGGIAGLLTALNLLKYFDVDLYEVFPKVGYRKHCTGVVSLITAHECLGKDFIDNYFNKLIIRLGSLRAELYSSTPFACRLSRVKHEVYLSNLIKGLGGKVLLKHRVLKVIKSSRGYELIVKCPDSIVRRFTYDYVVITEGYPSRLSRELGFKPVTEVLVGAQYRVKLRKALSDSLVNTLIVNYCIDSTCGFTWFTPLSRREALVGIATKYYVGNELIGVLNKLTKAIAKTLRTDYEVKDLFGGYVLRGYPKELVRGRVIALGDTNTTTKPVSGGGIYPILKTAKQVTKQLSKGELTNGVGEEVIKELKKQYMIYETVSRLRNALSKLRISIQTKITPQQYDQHQTLIANILKQNVSLLSIKLK